MNQNLPPLPEQKEKRRLQNAAKDQTRSGGDAATRRQAALGQEQGEKQQQQNATGDQLHSPIPAWAHFVDTCWQVCQLALGEG